MKPIAITLGDPAGIGPEVAAKVLAQQRAQTNPWLLVGSAWALSFAGNTLGANVDVTVEFSTDGTTYTPFGGTLGLNAVDTQYVVGLGADASDVAFVRLNLGAGARIDNVSLEATVGAPVPEPTTAVLAIAGLAGLGIVGRRRA